MYYTSITFQILWVPASGRIKMMNGMRTSGRLRILFNEFPARWFIFGIKRPGCRGATGPGGEYSATYSCYITRSSARALDSLSELLGTIGSGEGVDYRSELVAQKNTVVGGVKTDAVVGHAVLRLVVRTDLLRTVAVADLA